MLSSPLFLTIISNLPLSLATITCLDIGATATAQWTNSAELTCTWTGIVGSNFGINIVTDGEYVLPFGFEVK
jgi:hypothetical protein